MVLGQLFILVEKTKNLPYITPSPKQFVSMGKTINFLEYNIEYVQ